MAKTWIDAHGHYAAPGPALSRGGPGTEAGGAWVFAVDTSLAYMDRTGIAAQLISNCSPITKSDVIVASNTYGASLIKAHPKRFGLVAMLPLADPARAVAEICRASEELGADGFAVLSNFDGVYLGDPRFEPVWAALDTLDATLFIHPTTRGYGDLALGRTGALIEAPFDTARTVVDMLYAGVFRRYPRFNVLLAHGGGALPSLAGRIANFGDGARGWVANPHGITAVEMRAAFARFYYDTALAGTAHSIDPILDVTTPDHVVYGADFGAPCTDPELCDLNLAATRGYERLTPTQREALGTNVLALFPKFAERIGASSRDQVAAAAE
ncbi:MAG TPA: amidohydrolase family protein [Stellaceae bacterium]|nr:amidohydrolase family protein [Stellaceae bacterium]